MDYNALLPFIDQLPDTHFICVGDVMIDHYIFGDVKRISPEAPVPVVNFSREEYILGGAGNVVHNLLSFGGSGSLIATSGLDKGRNRLLELLQGFENLMPYIFADKQRQTTIKQRHVAANQQLLRVDYEDNKALSKDTFERLLESFEEEAASHSNAILIISDYDKGVVSPPLLEKIIAQAKAKNMRVVVDPKKVDFRYYAGADIVTPNLKELELAVGQDLKDNESIVRAAQTLIETHDFQAMLVTRSAAGMTLVTQDSVTHFEAFARDVYDVSGAGDTVIATLAAMLNAGADFTQATAMANIAGGLVVAKMGTATLTRQELRAGVRRIVRGSSDSQIFTLNQLKPQLEAWRDTKKTIGFTNGCFDLLHPGHIKLLKEAKANCDVLIVGLNSDASVKRLKGESRPIQQQTARADVLASIGGVDAVTIFDEDTPLELITAIQPDILIKGADYREDEIVGANVVKAKGGKVVRVDLVDGQSTTNLIEKTS